MNKTKYKYIGLFCFVLAWLFCFWFILDQVWKQTKQSSMYTVVFSTIKTRTHTHKTLWETILSSLNHDSLELEIVRTSSNGHFERCRQFFLKIRKNRTCDRGKTSELIRQKLRHPKERRLNPKLSSVVQLAQQQGIPKSYLEEPNKN